MSFRYSIIVPTLNRTQELEALLISIREQNFKDFEIIIVDQNEDDRLSNIMSAFKNEFTIKHIKIETKGASIARNVGIENAKGEILTFPDDDCEFPIDLLSKISEVFRTEIHLDGITIPARDKQEAASVARLSSKGGQVNKSNVLKRAIEAGIYIKSNKLNGIRFDEKLGVGANSPWWSDEGADFILKIIYKGSIINYMPHLYIYHPNPIITYNEKAIIRSFKYGCGRGKFLRMHDYPLWHVFYIWSLYIAGIAIGLFQLNISKAKFYLFGLKGRVTGYLDKS